MFLPRHVRPVRLAAILVGLGWLALTLFGRALGLSADPISAALSFAIGTLVPLLVTLLPAPPSAPPPALQKALAPVLVPASIAGALALPLGPGLAGGIAACLWVTGAAFLATLGAARAWGARRAGEHRGRELALGLALVSLPVGAIWLVMSRFGLDPLNISSLFVLTTAVHFHFTSFGATSLVTLARERATGRTKTALSLLIAAMFVGIVAVAIGWLGVRRALVGGSHLLATTVIAAALISMVVGLRTFTSPLAKGALVLCSLAPLASMPLAAGYVIGRVELDLMVHAHGMANAYGFVGLGILAHLLEAQARAGRAPS